MYSPTFLFNLQFRLTNKKNKLKYYTTSDNTVDQSTAVRSPAAGDEDGDGDKDLDEGGTLHSGGEQQTLPAHNDAWNTTLTFPS